MGKAKKIARGAGRAVLAFFGLLLALVSFAGVFFAVAEACVDRSARVLPSYEREDIREVLEKEVWTDEDYALLYRQTGLGRSALDMMKGETDRIISFQDNLFYQGEIMHDMASFTTPHDQMVDYVAPLAPLEDGDVIVSSSCHTFGWRNGHAAIVTDFLAQDVLESIAPGYLSSTGTAYWFQKASNFIVLRLKGVSKEERAEIAAWAEENLSGIPYSIFVGIFTPKDWGEQKPEVTHCSHLVWQAFWHFGYEIDSDGGPVCTPRDIAASDLFEVVQVSGFDPEKLW